MFVYGCCSLLFGTKKKREKFEIRKRKRKSCTVGCCCFSGRCVRIFGWSLFNFGEPFGIFRRASVMLSKGSLVSFGLFPNIGLFLEGFGFGSFLVPSGFFFSIHIFFSFFLFFGGNSYLFWFTKNRFLGKRFLLFHC